MNAPLAAQPRGVASALQVLEFSRAFLNGQRGWCVVLKVYLDETGIHDDAEMVAVAGYISRPKHWQAWTKDWNVHKRRVPAGKKPIKVFHSTDCATYHKEFDGWTKEERDPYVAQLLPVMPSHDLAGIVIGVNLRDLAAAMKSHPELVEMFGTPYTACFQWAISIIMEIATDRGNGERMAFIHEVNDFKGECFKAFEYVQANLNPRGIPITLGFGSKEDYPPLQAADVLAYEGGKFLKNPTGIPRRAWTALDPDKSRIIARSYSKTNADELIRLLTEFRARLLAQGWDGKVETIFSKARSKASASSSAPTSLAMSRNRFDCSGSSGVSFGFVKVVTRLVMDARTKLNRVLHSLINP